MTTPRTTPRTTPSRDYRITIRGQQFKVPGVTTVVGMLDKPALTAWKVGLAAQTGSSRAAKQQANEAADRGTRVHEAALLLAQGKTLIPGPSDNLVDRCVVNVAGWISDNVIEVLLAEVPVYHRTYLYAGRPDLLCVLRGRSGVYLCDWKTTKATALYPEWRLQLGAYALTDEVREAAGRCIVHAGVVTIDPSGDCEPHIHEVDELARAGAAFLNLLAVYTWRSSLQQ